MSWPEIKHKLAASATLARSSAQESERRNKAGLLDSGRIARGFGAWEPSQSRARAEVACSLKGRSERTLGPNECTISLRVVGDFPITCIESRLQAEWPRV